MSEQGQQTPHADEQRLIAFLSAQPDVAAAYLFGSRATGRDISRSDIDIAVLLHDDSEPSGCIERRLELARHLDRLADRPVDVVVLNTAPLVLRHQVLVTGRLLYEGERAARVNFEVRTGKLYADLRPMREFFRATLFEEIREGRLGQRR